jgi:hypothetical protein
LVSGRSRYGDAAEQRDDERCARIGFEPRVLVFGDSGIDDLVRGLNAPVPSNDEQPVLGREPQAGQARNEVALVGAQLLTGLAVEDPGAGSIQLG